MTAQRQSVTWLRQRTQEQARLRSQVEALLRRDDRLVAAWWFGSYARGASDALSDLDIWLVVDDRYLAQLVDQRFRYIEQLGQPLMVLEVWNNAPDPGAYLMANYLASSGLYQVDWYWQPARQARVPRDARPIFDRAGLPSAPERVTVDFARGSQAGGDGKARWSDKQHEHLLRAVTFGSVFFWSMVPIVAKKIARRELDTADSLLDKLVPQINAIAELLDIPPYAPASPTQGQNATESALRQLAALRRITAAMHAMEPAIAAVGAELPNRIHAAVHAQLDRIEQMIRLGVSLQEIEHDER